MNAQFNADQALAMLSQLIAQHGPQAIEIAAQTVRVDAVGALIGGTGCAVMAFLFFRCGRWALVKCGRPRDGLYDDRSGYGVALGVCGLGFVGFAVAAFNLIASPWTWVALFNPKLALAHEIIARIAQ